MCQLGCSRQPVDMSDAIKSMEIPQATRKGQKDDAVRRLRKREMKRSRGQSLCLEMRCPFSFCRNPSWLVDLIMKGTSNSRRHLELV